MSLPLQTPVAEHSEMGSVRYRFGPFQLCIATRQLLRDNIRIPLADKAFEMLLVLVKKQGELVTKDELMSGVWPNTFVGEDSLKQGISGLRRSLEDDPAQPRFIATVARKGYRFVAPVTIDSEPAVHSQLIGPPVPDRAPVSPTRTRTSGVGAVAVLALLAATVGLVWTMRPGALDDTARPERLRFTLQTPPATLLVSAGAVSPNGRHVAFVAGDEQSGQTKLWIHTLSTATVREVEGSEGASNPFWAPDSETVGFFSGSRVVRAALAGGPPRIISVTVSPRPPGGSWSTRDEILFADFEGLFLVPATGGPARKVVSPSSEGKEVSIGWPQFLPDGRSFLYEAKSAQPELASIYVGSLANAERIKLLVAGGQQVAYADGFLAYIEARQLKTRAFDLASRRLTGEPITVADSIPDDALISASLNGIIAFGGSASQRLTWFDRSGNPLNGLNSPESLTSLSLSPDGQLLLGRGLRSRWIWLVDVTRGVATRFGEGGGPAWSPDGKSVAFTATRQPAVSGVYLRAFEGGQEELLTVAPNPVLNDFTPDGQYIVYVTSGPSTRQDLWLLNLNTKKPTVLLSSTASEIQAQVSPNGRWIAYSSDEDGVFQVYLQAFPELGRKQRISTAGGTQPQWRSDGKELFYLSGDQTLMSVAVSDGSLLRLGIAKPLFHTPLLGPTSDYASHYAASGDGQRFVMGQVPLSGPREPITIVANWQSSR